MTSESLAAGKITLAWNPSTGTNIAGYRIHYGGSSRTYTNMVSVGTTSATVTNLKDGATYYFAATAYDSTGLESDFSNEASATTAAPTNAPPTLNDLTSVTINEDAGMQSVSLAGISSGSASESQTLTVTAASSNTGLIPNPSIVYTSPNATGTLNFTPVANASGIATITVTVNDSGTSNNVVTRSFTVTVTPVNDAPTLNALSNLSINENAAAQTVSLAGITAGGGESQSLVVTATSSNPGLIPNPTVTYTSPNATGSLSFTPVAFGNGTATITVIVNDSDASNNLVTRTFTVTVNAVNQAPTLNALNNATINENDGAQSVSLSGISTGATNESQTLTITATSSNPGLIPNPTVTYTSPNATGSLSYTPAAFGNGSATITVTVNDGQAQNNTVTRSFIVTVNAVNQAPTLSALNNVTINEGASAQTVNLAGISTGATNESQTLSITATSSNPGLIPNPTVTYTSPNATGSLSFTPVAFANGAATITVTVNDGQAQNNTVTRTFTVTVNAVNQAPTLNALGNVTLNQNAAQQTVNLAGISTGATNESQTLTVTATSSNTVTRTFSVTVNAINQAPTLTSIPNMTLNENAGLQSVGLSGITSGGSNELQTLAVTATSSNTGLVPNPTVNYTSANSTGTLTFTPVANAFGSALITVTVNDGGTSNNIVTKTFTVTVNPVNQAPTLNAINNVTVSQNASQQTVNLSGISSGAANENQTLTVSATSSNPSLIPTPAVSYTSPNTTGSLTFTPASQSSGSSTITVTVNDGGASNNIVTKTFTVTVTPVNQVPTLNAINNLSINENDGTQTVGLSGISSGAAGENQTLTVTATSSNTGLIPNPTVSYASPATTGTLSFAPVSYASGSATITVKVNDGAASNNIVTRTFTVSVKSVNQAPTISHIDAQSTPEDTATPAIAFTIGDIETAASNLTVVATSDNLVAVPTNNIVFGGSNSNRTVTITPAPGESGEANITITVNDGAASASSTFQLSIVAGRPVNTPPTITDIADQTVNPDTATAAIPFTVGDLESDPASLTVSATSSDTSILPLGNIVFGGSGASRTVTLTPATGMLGTSDVTITVDDGIDTTTTTFNFKARPAAVVLPNLTVTLIGDGKVTPDLSGQKLTLGRSYALTAMPAKGQAFAGWSGSATSLAQRIAFVLKSNTVLQATFVPVTVTTNGKGTVYPNLMTSTSLLINKSYTVTATPGAGQIFVGWTGSVTSSNPRVTLVLKPGFSAQANFIPNPYLAIQGTYNGLFHENDAVRPDSAGYFTATVTASGGYSGSIQQGGVRTGFSGKLDLNFNGTSALKLKGSNVTVQVRIGTNDQADQVFGTITAPTWASTLLGDRAVFSSVKGHTAPNSGSYTLILPGKDGNPNLPGGDGYGTVRISAAGMATFTGTLADGTPVSQSAPVSKNGEWPFYISLYSGKGCIMSWLTFTNDAKVDLSGMVSWIKPAISNATYYPAGFTYDFEAAGSAYQPPALSTMHVLSLTNANVLFSGGNLSADFVNAISLGNFSKVTNLSTNKLTLTFSTTSGTYTGSVIDPASNKARAFGGAVFQKQNTAFGMLRGTNQTSQVFISEEIPAPVGPPS